MKVTNHIIKGVKTVVFCIIAPFVFMYGLITGFVKGFFEGFRKAIKEGN